MKYLEQALEDFEMLIEEDPDNLKGLFYKAKTQKKQGDINNATLSFE